ncbi:MAG TPA: flagellar brake protein [Azonexus sp.]|nr:flagellar brake protein [Azonexus sp.]
MNNTYTDEEIERCTLRGVREIAFQLRGLIKQGERISVTFDGGQQSFLTVLIDVSEDNAHLYFDVGGSDEINRAYLRADHCVFTSVVNGIRIQFSAPQGREAKLRGERVFAAPVPKSLLRLQRRDVFRLQLPSAKPYICRIRRGTPEEKELPLHDISIGGIGILSYEKLEFEPLEVLENCWIDLRDSGALALALEVRYINPLESRTGKQLWHMGCRFLKLSALNETLIQRFMGRLEAERRAMQAD